MPRPHSRAIVLPTTLTIPEHAAALALDLLHRGQRVERLAGLADGDVQRVVLDDGIAVAKLGRRLRVRRYARELLDELRAHQSREVRRAAAQDLHAPNLEQLARRVLERAEVRRLKTRLEAAAERAADRVRLLGHFLAHEVRMLAFVEGFSGPIDRERRLLRGAAC